MLFKYLKYIGACNLTDKIDWTKCLQYWNERNNHSDALLSAETEYYLKKWVKYFINVLRKNILFVAEHINVVS